LYRATCAKGKRVASVLLQKNRATAAIFDQPDGDVLAILGCGAVHRPSLAWMPLPISLDLYLLFTPSPIRPIYRSC